MPLLSQEEKLSLLFSVVFVVFSFFKMFIILFVGLRLGGNLLRIHSCKELRRCHYFNSASLIVFLISGDDTVGQLINSRAVLGSILIVFPTAAKHFNYVLTAQVCYIYEIGYEAEFGIYLVHRVLVFPPQINGVDKGQGGYYELHFTCIAQGENTLGIW